jgi:hypothetical protein
MHLSRIRVPSSAFKDCCFLFSLKFLPIKSQAVHGNHGGCRYLRLNYPSIVSLLYHLKAGFERQILGELVFRARHCRLDRIYLIGNKVGESAKLKIVEFIFSRFTCKPFPNVVLGCALEGSVQWSVHNSILPCGHLLATAHIRAKNNAIGEEFEGFYGLLGDIWRQGVG